MNSGWVKLHRKTLDNPVICKDSDHFAIWGFLLLKATHKGYDEIWKGQKVKLDPGQLITGRKKIAEKFNVNETKVQRVLKKFENEHQIEQQTSNQNRLITIKNWEQYQQSEQQNEQPLNNKRTTTEQPLNTYNNEKNGNNEKNENNNSVKKNLTAARQILNDVYKYFDIEVIKGLTEKQKEEWVDVIDKLNRIDGYDFEDIKDVVIWARENEFWAKNLLSIPSLRKKRDGVSKFFKIVKSMDYERRKPKKQISKEKAERIAEITFKNLDKYGDKGKGSL